MRILYGVQATGNGHLSRAREMAKHFAKTNIDVDYLISGRERRKLHDMEVFGDYLYYHGITFQTKNGSVQAISTAWNFKPYQLICDARALDIDKYDLIISDFEPVSAWAARLQGKSSIGIGHQYAFEGHVPRASGKWFSKQVMKYFAPVDIHVGLHWHRFNPSILPPIISPNLKPESQTRNKRKIVVYLPFENQDVITKLLKRVSGYEFFQYAPGLGNGAEENIQLRAPSVKGFHDDLEDCDGVICNTGFELISECLQLGIPVLTTPLSGQVEQLSNAVALQNLGLAEVVTKLNAKHIRQWLNQKQPGSSSRYPDVAKALVDWIQQGQTKSVQALSESLWGNQINPTL